jgi:hypothetical protein
LQNKQLTLQPCIYLMTTGKIELLNKKEQQWNQRKLTVSLFKIHQKVPKCFKQEKTSSFNKRTFPQFVKLWNDLLNVFTVKLWDLSAYNC